MIKAIIFDLGGVYFTDGTSKAVKKVSRKYNLNSRDVSDFFGTKNKIGRLYRQGRLSSRQFWQEFQRQFKIKVNKDDIIKQWILCYKPIQENLNLIIKLRKKGLKIYFLSDNVKERTQVLQRKYNFLRNFDYGIFSHEAGITKKDGDRIFKLILKKTSNDPANVIFIDDKEDYVKIARELGMNALHYKNTKQLEKELRMLINF
ncbi:MAG: HAD family phosphatase [Nanoarchaeota archaeon]